MTDLQQLMGGPYATVHDPERLRGVLREFPVLYWMIDMMIGTGGLPAEERERIAGMHAVQRLLSHLCTQAEHRLERVEALLPARRAVAVSPWQRRPDAAAPNNLSLIPVVTSQDDPLRQLVSAHAWLAEGEHSHPHSYPDSDLLLVVTFGSPVIMCWDEHGQQYELMTRVGYHIAIPAGTAHCIYNPGPDRAILDQIRIRADHAELLLHPELTPELTRVGSVQLAKAGS